MKIVRARARVAGERSEREGAIEASSRKRYLQNKIFFVSSEKK